MIEYTSPFYLAGEEGRTLDATPRLLEALGIRMPVLLLTSLGVDTLTFVIEGFMVSLLPDDEQEVSLSDSAGRVLFRGKVRRGYELKEDRFTFLAANDWKRMMNAPVKGISTTRPYRIYPEQPVGTTLASLIGLAQADGLRVAPPLTMPAMYAAPQMTLRSRSYAEAISTVLQMVPDAGTRWDYTSNPPRLTITRRGVPHVIDASGGLDAAGLEDAKLELQAWRRALGVVIHYALRTSHLGYTLATQTGGDPEAEAGRMISLMFSGFERADALPLESLNAAITAYNEALAAINKAAADVDSLAGRATLPMVWDEIKLLDPALVSALAAGTFTMALANSNRYSYYSQYYQSPYDPDPYTPNRTVEQTVFELKNATGTTIRSGWYPIRPGTFTDAQLTQAGATKQTMYFEGDLRGSSRGHTYLHPGLESLRGAQGSRVRFYTGYTSATVTTGTPSTINPTEYTRFYFYSARIPVTVINKTPAQVAAAIKAGLGGEIIELDEATAFLRPPDGFAENYFQAQNYTPLTGTMIFLPDAPWKPAPGDWVQITGTREPMWGVGIAPISQVSIDLVSGRLTATAGYPPRQEINTLLDAIKFSPEDNFERE